MTRQDYKKIRSALTQTQREAFSKRVCRAIIETYEYKAARRIMAYWAIGDELSLKMLIDHAVEEGKEIYLPVCGKDGHMDCARYTGGDKLKMGACGVPEPEGELMAPEQLQLILIPMLAFNGQCCRTGWGGGYYDRYLPRTDAYRLGAAFSCQYDADMTVKPNDAALDKIITEEKVYLSESAERHRECLRIF